MMYKGKFSYPFDEVDYIYKKNCTHHLVDLVSTTSLPSVLKSSSQFFVFVGVVSFLYCIGAMVYYVCFENPAKYGPGGAERDFKSVATIVSFLAYHQTLNFLNFTQFFYLKSIPYISLSLIFNVGFCCDHHSNSVLVLCFGCMGCWYPKAQR